MHTLKGSGTEPVPSWVTFDSANLKLNIQTPRLQTDTTFKVEIESVVDGDIAHKAMKTVQLEVVAFPCNVKKCKECVEKEKSLCRT